MNYLSDHIFGVSFSLHRASELGINKKSVLRTACKDLGFKRFRLMSYWNIHEQNKGVYDFEELDWQLDMVAKYGGEVTLSVGKRQPRWPECHMPLWAQVLPSQEWYQALFDYITVVIKRYRDHPALHSWQLENEALLKEFGYCVDQDYSHTRLQKELEIIKSLDTNHPVIMTLSDSWGLPVRAPKPDAYAMSMYRITINKRGRYARSKRPPNFYKVRASLIKVLKNRPVFIHELQAEPWLPRTIMQTPVADQLQFMNKDIIRNNIEYAIRTGMNPIDLWGLEWWYWLKTVHATPEIWRSIKQLRATYDS
jgi:hypothetical protein